MENDFLKMVGKVLLGAMFIVFAITLLITAGASYIGFEVDKLRFVIAIAVEVAVFALGIKLYTKY